LCFQKSTGYAYVHESGLLQKEKEGRGNSKKGETQSGESGGREGRGRKETSMADVVKSTKGRGTEKEKDP